MTGYSGYYIRGGGVSRASPKMTKGDWREGVSQKITNRWFGEGRVHSALASYMGSYEVKAKIYGVKCATLRQSGNLVRCSDGHGDSNGHSPKSPRQAPHFRFIGHFTKLEPSHRTSIYFFQAVCIVEVGSSCQKTTTKVPKNKNLNPKSR